MRRNNAVPLILVALLGLFVIGGLAAGIVYWALSELDSPEVANTGSPQRQPEAYLNTETSNSTGDSNPGRNPQVPPPPKTIEPPPVTALEGAQLPAPLELAGPQTIHAVYSIRPPVGFTVHETRKLGNAQRWRLENTWWSEERSARFKFVIERDPEYTFGSMPRVSNRILPPGEASAEVARVDGIYVLPAAAIDTATVGGVPFTRAISRAGNPLAGENGLLYAAYHYDRLILIEANSETPDALLFDKLRSAAESFRVLQQASELPPPDGLVADEQHFAGTLPVTRIGDVIAIDAPRPGGPKVTSVAIMDGGKLLAYGTSQGTVHVHDVATKDEYNQYRPVRNDDIKPLFFLGEKYLYSVSWGFRVSVRMNIETKETFYVSYGEHYASNGDNSRLAAAKAANIFVGPLVGRPEFVLGGSGREISCIETAGDGLEVAFGTRGGDVSVWKAGESSFKFSKPKSHPGGTTQLAYTSDRKLLFSAGNNMEVICWDVAADKPAWRKPRFGRVYGMIVLPGDELLAMLHGGRMEVWRISDGEFHKRYPLPFKGELVGFAKNGSHAVVSKEGASDLSDLHVVALNE